MLGAALNYWKNPYGGTMLLLGAIAGYKQFDRMQQEDAQVWIVWVGLLGFVVVGTHWLKKIDPFFVERRRQRNLPYQMWLDSLEPIQEAKEYLDKLESGRYRPQYRERAGRLIQQVADHLDQAHVPHPPVGTDWSNIVVWLDRLYRLDTWCGWRNPEGYELAIQPNINSVVA